MIRTIAQWRNCNPDVMANGPSRAAIFHAFVAAKSDILELHAQNAAMREVLRVIAYPRRGTIEEERDIFDISALIQQKYSLEQLEEQTHETPTDDSGISAGSRRQPVEIGTRSSEASAPCIPGQSQKAG